MTVHVECADTRSLDEALTLFLAIRQRVDPIAANLIERQDAGVTWEAVAAASNLSVTETH